MEMVFLLEMVFKLVIYEFDLFILLFFDSCVS